MYLFQEDIEHHIKRNTGCEKFDSLYQLYDIFHNIDYFFINIFAEKNSLLDISFLKETSEKYKINSWVVRCENQQESTPIQAKAFSDIHKSKNWNIFVDYIQSMLNRGYNCIIHEVVIGPYISNRLDWTFSFGILYENNQPIIEIYPATDASSIKWGKLTPTDIIQIDKNCEIYHTKITDEKLLKEYQKQKLIEWTEKFQNEIPNDVQNKKQYTNINDLQQLLIERKHWLFNINQIRKEIKIYQTKLINIALKYLDYANKHNIHINSHIIHGSLLFNGRLIIWDISSNKRWAHLTKT